MLVQRSIVNLHPEIKPRFFLSYSIRYNGFDYSKLKIRCLFSLKIWRLGKSGIETLNEFFNHYLACLPCKLNNPRIPSNIGWLNNHPSNVFPQRQKTVGVNGYFYVEMSGLNNGPGNGWKNVFSTTPLTINQLWKEKKKKENRFWYDYYSTNMKSIISFSLNK